MRPVPARGDAPLLRSPGLRVQAARGREHRLCGLAAAETVQGGCRAVQQARLARLPIERVQGARGEACEQLRNADRGRALARFEPQLEQGRGRPVAPVRVLDRATGGEHPEIAVEVAGREQPLRAAGEPTCLSGVSSGGRSWITAGHFRPGSSAAASDT